MWRVNLPASLQPTSLKLLPKDALRQLPAQVLKVCCHQMITPSLSANLSCFTVQMGFVCKLFLDMLSMNYHGVDNRVKWRSSGLVGISLAHSQHALYIISKAWANQVNCLPWIKSSSDLDSFLQNKKLSIPLLPTIISPWAAHSPNVTYTGLMVDIQHTWEEQPYEMRTYPAATYWPLWERARHVPLMQPSSTNLWTQSRVAMSHTYTSPSSVRDTCHMQDIVGLSQHLQHIMKFTSFPIQWLLAADKSCSL